MLGKPNSYIWFVSFAIFLYGMEWNDSISFMDVGMVGRIILKPHVPLYELFLSLCS